MTSEQTSWWVYIVKSQKGKLYTGITTDVERRYQEHLQVAEGGKKGAKFFRSDPPKALVYREQCVDRSEASKREAMIKQLKRKDKLTLICQSGGDSKAK